MLRTLPVMSAMLLAISLSSQGAEPRCVIRPREVWSAYFGGVEKVMHVDVAAVEAVKVRAAWTLSVEGRVVERKELPLALEPAKPATLDIPVRFPEVKEGVVMPATLTVGVTEEGKDKAAVSWEHPLWIYPQNPFAGREMWLEKLRITLFDPEGKTAKILEAAKVPFDTVRNADALAEVREVVVVIGEGTSFRDHRGLPEIMMKLAAAGVPVLCLAPREGEFPFPGSEGNDRSSPTAVILKQSAVIGELDKKLDSVMWPPDGRVVATRIQLQGDRTGVMAMVTEENAGWPWVELRYGKRALVICGFAVMEKWETGPTPRFLFVKMLEELDKSTK